MGTGQLSARQRTAPAAVGFLGAAMRSREQVLAYLEAEFARSDAPDGTRLPTVRELARQLSVNPSAVQSAFSQLARQGRIRTQVGNGTFLVAPPEKKKTEAFRLTLNLWLPAGWSADDWAYRIAGSIVHAVMHGAAPMVLVPIYQGPEDSADANRQLLANMAQVDGIILFPTLHGNDEVQAAYARARKLVVHLHPPAPTATANFVSADFYGACFRVAEAWKQTGRRRVAFLRGPLQHSVSEWLSYVGLVNGLGSELGRDISLRLVAAGQQGSETEGYRATRQLLEERDWQPDAIYCTGDSVALGAVRALQERGLNVPQDASVVGGTGLSLADSRCPQLTRVHQPCEQLGEELVAMMCQRIERNGDSVPGRFLPTPFIGGVTTRPEENEILQIGHEREQSTTA